MTGVKAAERVHSDGGAEGCGRGSASLSLPRAVGRLTEDPFGTADIRQRVLEAWAASPARFREDANAEEDLVLGGYRDRLLIELAQNAADAATAAGVPGHLRLTLGGDVLRAANVGAPLDAVGVQGLASLRASGKTGSVSVGRYGVGFAAVLAVSDEPSIVSRSGGIRFSATDTRAAVAGITQLASEVERRQDAVRGFVPVLRLPFPITDSDSLPPEGFDTEVRLPLRPGTESLVRSLLDGIRAEALLGLPGLVRLDVEDRVLQRTDDSRDVLLHDGDRTEAWRLSTASGLLPDDLLADRPVEERERPQWTVTWAVPVVDGVPQPLTGRQVLHAPTPSDEPLSLPLRLIASYPLAPDRRHVAPSAVTDFLTAAAARAFGGLVLDLAEEPEVLSLIPRAGLAAAALDAALGAAIVAELRTLAWLPEAASPRPQQGPLPSTRISPDRATALDPVSEEFVTVLTEVIGGLLPASWSRRTDASVLSALGVRRMDLAGVIEVVSTVERPTGWWAQLYGALERTSSLDDRDALSAIPVPLADGRMAYGARGLLLPEPDLDTGNLGALGLRLVDPEAFGTDHARRFLERLGASPATATGVLNSPAVRSAVEASYEEEDPAPIAAAVLALVRMAGPAPGAHPWLADLALSDAEGEWTPAAELMLPGSRLASVIAPDALSCVDSDLVTTYGPETLVAVGVLDTFAVLRLDSVELGEEEHDLDDENRWYDALFDRLPPGDRPPTANGVLAVRDLDLVAEDRWAAALDLLAQLPADVFDDLLVTVDSSATVPVPSYTRWWLSTHPVLNRRRPDRLREPDAAELEGLFDPADVAPEILRLLSCLSSIDDAVAEPGTALELLDRVGKAHRTVRADVLPDIYPRLAVALEGMDVDPPDRVRVGPGHTVDRDEAVVLDAPHLLPLLDRIPVPAAGRATAVADLLDLPLATEIVSATVTSTATTVSDWVDVAGASVAARRLGVASLSGRVATHDPLRVTGHRDVPWWPETEIDHVDAGAGPAALGRALAWRHDRWPLRAALAEAFDCPGEADRLDAEDGAG